MRALVCCCLLAALAVAAHAGGLVPEGVAGERGAQMDWKPLKKELENWAFTENFAVHIANADGQLFLYEHGNMTLDTRVVMESTSKWPSAAMVMGLVADGTIESLDDHPQKYIRWWTSDPTDARSNVTLRQLLSFTSGYSGFPPHTKFTPCAYDSLADFDECNQKQYNNATLAYPPGTRFDYNSLHLQFAGAMAVAASNKTIFQLYDQYLFNRLGMANSTCSPDGATNPQLATCLVTTGRDYGRFLDGLLTFKIFDKEHVLEMEKDYTPGSIMQGGPTYGHYCMGHFYECFFNPAGFTPTCEEANVHADPGAFGYYPLIDRVNNYFLQIVVMESGKFYPRSGIPEYLRLAAKPYADAIMRGEDPTTQTNRESLLALTLDDVNYIQASMGGEAEWAWGTAMPLRAGLPRS